MSNKKELQQWALEEYEKMKAQENPEEEKRAWEDMIVWGSNYWHVDEKGNRKYLGPFRDKHYVTGEQLDEE